MARIVFADPSEGQTDFYANRDLISESLAVSVRPTRLDDYRRPLASEQIALIADFLRSLDGGLARGDQGCASCAAAMTRLRPLALAR